MARTCVIQCNLKNFPFGADSLPAEACRLFRSSGIRKIVMALFLQIIYIVILIFQIILFVITIRKKTKKIWRILFSAELIPLLISIGLMIYYNNLPGYGFMPGITYLGEILSSLGAVVLYCISFLISICSYIAISNKQT